MRAGLFVTPETESRFDIADLSARVRTARDAGFDSSWFAKHFVTGPSMRQFRMGWPWDEILTSIRRVGKIMASL
jgi:alkanesulfonate monooxygenase SsuD/methylene tetrahydromethanopterin reductase-like flavin-dependent oxidoreductase (luciferase family)